MVGEKSNKWKGTEVNVIRWTNDSFGIDRRGWLGIRDELFPCLDKDNHMKVTRTNSTEFI